MTDKNTVLVRNVKPKALISLITQPFIAKLLIKKPCKDLNLCRVAAGKRYCVLIKTVSQIIARLLQPNEITQTYVVIMHFARTHHVTTGAFAVWRAEDVARFMDGNKVISVTDIE